MTKKGLAGFVLIGVLLVSGCATPRPVPPKPPAPSRVIRRLAVVSFSGLGGADATNAFIRQLLQTPVKVLKQAPNQMVDAVLSGSVTEYRPESHLTVFLSSAPRVNASGQRVTVSNPIVSLSESPVIAEGTAFSQPGVQMIATHASVGVSVRLTDAVSGTVIWSQAYAYEGIDPSTAWQHVARTLVQSMSRLLPPPDKPIPGRPPVHP